jgi:hypothetical protein
MDTLPLIGMPRESWDTILRNGEEVLDDELRTVDREYLIEILTSQECMQIDPVEIYWEAWDRLQYIKDDLIHSSRDAEIAYHQHQAHRLLVSLGCFPLIIAGNKERQRERIEACAKLSRRSFDSLSRIWHEEKKQSQYARFRDEFIRYVDVLLASREQKDPRPLSFAALFAFRHMGSKYAAIRICNNRRR